MVLLADGACRLPLCVFRARNVIEVTQSVLKTLEGGKKLLASFQCPLGREQAREELRRITQFLRLAAKLVATECIELSECFAFLPNPAPASGQLLSRVERDWEVASVADQIIVRVSPVPNFQPGRHIECERGKASVESRS